MGFSATEPTDVLERPQKFFPVDSRPGHRPEFLSLDNAWLAACVVLIMVANAEPSLRECAGRLMQPMDFGFFYDPHNAADPVNHPGQLHVGYWRDDQKFYGHYGLLNTEARIVSYLGIARVNFLGVPTTGCSERFRKPGSGIIPRFGAKSATTTGSGSSRARTITMACGLSPVGGGVCSRP